MPISFDAAAEKVADLRDDLESEHEDATEDAIDDLQNEVRRQLILRDSVARGQLLRDILTGSSLSTNPDVFVSRAVHLPEWAKYVEHGTGQRGATDSMRGSIPYPSPSGAPPYDPIKNWIIAKNIQPREYDGQYELAAAIQQKIGELGTFPHPFIRPSWRGPRGKRHIYAENRSALKTAVRRF